MKEPEKLQQKSVSGSPDMAAATRRTSAYLGSGNPAVNKPVRARSEPPLGFKLLYKYAQQNHDHPKREECEACEPATPAVGM